MDVNGLPVSVDVAVSLKKRALTGLAKRTVAVLPSPACEMLASFSSATDVPLPGLFPQ